MARACLRAGASVRALHAPNHRISNPVLSAHDNHTDVTGLPQDGCLVPCQPQRSFLDLCRNTYKRGQWRTSAYASGAAELLHQLKRPAIQMQRPSKAGARGARCRRTGACCTGRTGCAVPFQRIRPSPKLFSYCGYVAVGSPPCPDSSMEQMIEITPCQMYGLRIITMK